MKSIQIKRVLLAAAMLAGVGMAYGNNVSTNYAVVYCKATISGNAEYDNPVVSVTLPPTEGYYDEEGNPLTYWNVGNVPAGGVADSWHGEGGPGRFTARNNGNVGSYFYVSTGYSYQIGARDNEQRGNYFDPWYVVHPDTFGCEEYERLYHPLVSPRGRRAGDEYHLAFTTDVTAKVPSWHSLDHGWTRGSWNGYEWTGSSWSTDDNQSYEQISGYMGYVDAGDYLTFDLKFWAPHECSKGESLFFTFCVEASEFPLWDHGRAVE